MTYISSTHMPLSEDLITTPCSGGELMGVVYLGRHVPSQILIALGEEKHDSRRTTGNRSHLGIVGMQSYHWDKARQMSMEHLAHTWHEVEAWKW